jgi:hypothetical protein
VLSMSLTLSGEAYVFYLKMFRPRWDLVRVVNEIPASIKGWNLLTSSAIVGILRSYVITKNLLDTGYTQAACPVFATT